MARLLIILAILAIVGYAFARPYLREAREERDRQRAAAEDPRARSIRQNHASVVRLLDDLLGDEMIYPVIPESKREQGRRLVDAYYDEGATK